MKTLIAVGLVSGSAFLLGTAPAQNPDQRQIAADATPSPARLAPFALTGDLAAAGALRSLGPSGLEALFDALGDKVEHYRDLLYHGEPRDSETDGLANAQRALDHVAAQYDALWTGLYWYTDLDAAKQQAETSGRPILSLRLLGNLDEPLSCANSRFFRTALYANESVSDYLRRHYVLHWESVRPVPKLTIDYGDGRVIETTITGNSLHYILDSDGAVMDVLPGLYGPDTFLMRLSQGVGATPTLPEVELTFDAEPIGLERTERAPTAVEAARIAVSKRLVETPALAALRADPELMREITTPQTNLQESLDKRSKALFIAQFGFNRRDAPPPGPERNAAMARMTEMMFALDRFNKSMSADTEANEKRRLRVLRQINSDQSLRTDLPRLTSWVYEWVFLTPESDPWLGMRSNEVYAGQWEPR